jgi:hypothetical protein
MSDNTAVILNHMKQRETDPELPRPRMSQLSLNILTQYVTQFLDRHGITHDRWNLGDFVCVGVPRDPVRFLFRLSPYIRYRGIPNNPNYPYFEQPAKIWVDGVGEQYIYFNVNEMDGFLTRVLQQFQLLPTQLVLPTPPNPVPMNYRWFGAWDTSVSGRNCLGLSYVLLR